MNLDLPRPDMIIAPENLEIVTMEMNEFITRMRNNSLVRNNIAYKLINSDMILFGNDVFDYDSDPFECRAFMFYDTEFMIGKADLQYCIFLNCKFKSGIEMVANFDYAYIKDCEMKKCEFRNSSFEKTSFNNVNLKNSSINRCYMRGAYLEHVDLTDSRLLQVDTRDVNTEDVVPGLNLISAKIFDDRVYPTIYPGRDLINSGNPDGFFMPVADVVAMPVADVVVGPLPRLPHGGKKRKSVKRNRKIKTRKTKVVKRRRTVKKYEKRH